MKLRDVLAVPFWLVAVLFDRIALAIGGIWTAQMFIETVVKQAKTLDIKIK
jgi:hypothetical protein